MDANAVFHGNAPSSPAALTLAAIGVAFCLAAGCIDIREHVTIRSDGAGEVTMEVKSDVDPDLASVMRRQSQGAPEHFYYPPTSEEDLRRLFPGDAFRVEVEEKGAKGKTGLAVKVAFDDVNRLLASPYGRVHSLSMERRDGELRFVALSGLRGLVALACAPDAGGGAMMAMVPPALTKLKEKHDEMRIEFRVTMPAALSHSSGRVDGSTAVWIVDRPQMASDEEAADAVNRRMEAACPSAEITFRPEPVLRLGLARFADLKEGPAGLTGVEVDRDAVSAAARFVPYRLKVTRYFDLTGEGHGGWDEGASLTGAVVLPAKLAPAKWGEVRVEEATDERGNDLTPRGDSFRQRTMWSTMRFGFGAPSREKAEKEDEVRRIVTLGFRTPDRAARTIERIRASVPVTYFGGSRIVKLEHAVAKDRVIDMAKGMRGALFGGSDSEITDPELAELGIEMNLSQAMVASGATVLILHVQEEETALSEIQVFDAEGRPWQTFTSGQAFGESAMKQAVVPGTPEPPLSLALLVRGGGAGASTTVKLPIELDDVPVGGPTEAE